MVLADVWNFFLHSFVRSWLKVGVTRLDEVVEVQAMNGKAFPF